MKDLDNFLTYVNAFYLVLKYHSEGVPLYTVSLIPC
jgi:hypothetical protein